MALGVSFNHIMDTEIMDTIYYNVKCTTLKHKLQKMNNEMTIQIKWACI